MPRERSRSLCLSAALTTPSSASYTVKSVKTNCYLVADVSATHLHMEVFDQAGAPLDTIDLYKLPAPTDLVAASSSGQVSLAWDPVPGATSYTVCYGTNSGGPYTNRESAATANATVTGLVNLTPYYFVVTANDSNGPSGPSPEATATPASIAPWIATLTRLDAGTITITGSAAAGQTCILLGATNLASPITWVPLSTTNAGLNGLFSLSDLQATSYPNRFYRVQTP